MVPEFIYLDALDTVRSSHAKPEKERRDSVTLGQAQVTLSLIRGMVPVFSQTQGWDSAAILSFAEANAPHAPFFRWLVGKGYVQFRMHDKANIVEGAVGSLEDQSLCSARGPSLRGPSLRWKGRLSSRLCATRSSPPRCQILLGAGSRR